MDIPEYELLSHPAPTQRRSHGSVGRILRQITTQAAPRSCGATSGMVSTIFAQLSFITLEVLFMKIMMTPRLIFHRTKYQENAGHITIAKLKDNTTTDDLFILWEFLTSTTTVGENRTRLRPNHAETPLHLHGRHKGR